MLVYTTGKGVNGFTLDPSIGEFCLSHRIWVVQKRTYLQYQWRNYVHFPDGVKQFIKYVQVEDSATNPVFFPVHRIALVADFPETSWRVEYDLSIYFKISKRKTCILYECNHLHLLSNRPEEKRQTVSEEFLIFSHLLCINELLFLSVQRKWLPWQKEFMAKYSSVMAQ